MAMSDARDVLVVDDDVAIAALVADCLSDEGYTVRIAYTGTGALDAIHTHTPDLVLLDIMMPEMTGDALLAYLRAHGFADLPIIMMSAASHLSRFSLTGATAQLAKPFNIEELIDCVNRHWRRQ
jgi:DNA-binding response OmpR family regulator